MNSFNSKAVLRAGGRQYEIYRLESLDKAGLRTHRLPYSLRVLLENLLRHENGKSVTAEDIKNLANWDPKAAPSIEIDFMPARVLMQDFTGVPEIVDLAAMRDAMKNLGGDPEVINPLLPAELVIDHSVLVQPVSMTSPQVVGFRFSGKLREGSTATDLVLTVTEILRKAGVIWKFVEYFGPSLHTLPLADRATIANMAPEYGATCGIFPVDASTLAYLRLSGRSKERLDLVEAYTQEQGLWHDATTPEAEYSDLLTLDLATIEPSLAGPKRPQDRVRLKDVKVSFENELHALRESFVSP